jgi:FtsH-binding integral membrane protein
MEAYVVATICSAYDGRTVLAAAFMTAGVVIALTIYACTTKTDFTVCGGLMWVLGSCFLMFGLFSFTFGPTARFVYSLIGVIIFGLYLVIDTQLIIGNQSYKLSKEDYILGAIILYLDIINIFIYILSILG